MKLFGQGDRFSAVHLIASGCVKLFEVDSDGTERLVALCLPGELIGMDGWAHGRHLYTAITAGATQLCQLHWPSMQPVAPPPALLERLLRKSVAQYDCSQPRWAHLSAAEKVSAFLNRFIERAGPGCELPLTRQELGSLLGMAEETVVRAMRVLRARRQPYLDGRRVLHMPGTPSEAGISAK